MRLPDPFRSLPAASPAPVWACLGIIATGFGGVLLGWSVVAGTDDASSQVVPTLGLGVGGFVVVVVGTVLLAVAVGRRDEVLLDRLLRGGLDLTAPQVPRAMRDRVFDVGLVVVAGAGVVWMGLGAHGAAGEDQVELARPYLVSGGLGGLSLLVATLGVLLTRARRRAAIRERAEVAPA